VNREHEQGEHEQPRERGQGGVVDQHGDGRDRDEGAEVVVLDVTRNRTVPAADPDGDGDSEVEVVDAAAEVVAVDPPEAALPWLERARSAERRPVVPAWLRSRADVEAAVRWAAGF